MSISFQSIKVFIRPLFYWFYLRYYYFLELIFPPKIDDPKIIPIIINNFNRLSLLKKLIESLEKRGHKNIFIIDNASTYPPLLEYYENCPYKIYHLKENVGFLALWETNIYKHFINDYYVYTDSDIVPVDECPEDFMSFFLETLKKNKFVSKVGFSLKLDDLPDYFAKKNEVIAWESKYYKTRVSNLLYKAPIDTTFALYRPRARGSANISIPMFRTAFPYEARHMPWYIDSNNLTYEEQYYINHSKTSTHWTNLNKPVTN